MSDTSQNDPLVTKTAHSEYLTEAFDDFMRTFEAFKDTNDQRLNEIERHMSADVITNEKLERINTAIDKHKRIVDNLALKSSRPSLSSSIEKNGVHTLQHKAAFDAYIRHGEQGQLKKLEEKALSVGSNPDGGYLVPSETETSVMRLLTDISPIRSIASVRQVSASVYKKPFTTVGAGSGWVAETGTRSETTSPTLAELSFPTMELYAMPSASQTLLDDAAVNIDEWISEEVNLAFAEQEGTAFVTGNGTNKPKGFMDYTKVANASWTWGNTGYVATGADADFDGTNPDANLIDLIYSIKSGYRANANWVMRRSTQAEIRKIKDADGNYLWRPGEQAGSKPTLLSYPVTESEDMSAIASDSYSIAFGDFKRGYLIVDRLGIRILRDPYSSKPYVLFYTTKRVGGGVQDFDAIKLLKFGTS
ncbi:MAG: phage major capsid protein [Pseudomonadota bacterium]